MAKTILLRLAQFPLILAVIYVLTILLAWVAPGSPFGHERALDPRTEAALIEKFHAGSPWQFMAYYPVRAIQGDLGPSMFYADWSVAEIIRDTLPVSVTLGLLAIVIALLVGIAVGTLAAVKRGGVVDWLSLSVSLIGISLPGFVTAALLLIASSNGVFKGVFAIGRSDKPIDYALPAFALSLAPMAYIARLTRVSMLDVLGSDYVRTARAKGLSNFTVVWKHCLRNAVLPVLSFLGPAAAVTLTGSFVIEVVFSMHGLGKHFVDSVLNRDRTLILGVVMVYSTFLLAFNLLVDVLYVVVDPRIDLSARGK